MIQNLKIALHLKEGEKNGGSIYYHQHTLWCWRTLF